jgi:hypothetical protein
MLFREYMYPGISSMMTFKNFFNSQLEIKFLEEEFYHQIPKIPVVCVIGKNGNGVTHLLNATCNKFKGKKAKTEIISWRWIKKMIKEKGKEFTIDEFLDFFSNYDLLGIDDIQEFNIKNRQQHLILMSFLELCNSAGIQLLFGCSKPEKNPMKYFAEEYPIKFIRIKNIDIESTYRLINYLLEHESKIPEYITRKVAKHNGTIQEYINCLISLRYQPEKFNLTGEESNQSLKFKKFFNSPQLRKCFLNDEGKVLTIKDFAKKF